MSGAKPPLTPTTPTSPTMELKRTRTRPRRKHIVPEVGSLFDLLHDHATTSLFLLPICWTDLHIQLLGCRFTQLPAQKTPTPSQTKSPRRSKRTPPTVVNIARDLNTLLAPDLTGPIGPYTLALKNILFALFPTHLFIAKTCADFNIRFGSRCYLRAVRCQVIWKHPDSDTRSFDSATTCSNRSGSQFVGSMNRTPVNDPLILAYVSRIHLNHVRRNCYRVLSGPNRLYNGPVHRLQSLRSRMLLPKNEDEDQYILAVIIALAQQSAYGNGEFTPKDVKVRVLTTSEEDESFVVYTATVPAGFLRMFHEPEKAPQGDTEIRIDYTQVPIWPVLGLKERLGQALGSEVVGDFDASNMETYEAELPPTPETPSPKRRRDVLSEVFNASFSEDRDSDSPVEAIGKRRCLEESRVGLVR
ncbi:hypothetical protein MGN70_000948 [Eutypa lata]|nr:hypothetical protein MGN70_000948 [Eutypa lata]